MQLQRIGNATEDTAVIEEVLPETLSCRREGGTTLLWRAPVFAHAVSS
jgi:hypothetical protein